MKINKKPTLLFFVAIISLFSSITAWADYGCDTCTAYYDSSIFTCDTCAAQPCPSCNTGYEACNYCGGYGYGSVETSCPGGCGRGGYGY